MFVSTLGFWCRLCFAAVLLLMFSARSIAAAADLQSFELDAGDAELTLKQFAKQARLDIVFDPQSVEGVQTQEVVGTLLPSIALERMLEGTPLVFKEDLETGAFAVTRSEVPPGDLTTRYTEPLIEEETEMKAKKNNWLKTVAAVLTLAIGTMPSQVSAQENEEEQVFELSPFNVDVSEDTGYLAKYSLSGSRLRLNLEDVTVPIDIITAEMIEDLGATTMDDLYDVISNFEDNGNPVFDAVYDSGNIFRIRGFTSNVTLRNFLRGTTPFEAYNASRLVAAKGPNSILFGSGPSGGSLNYFTKKYIIGGTDRTKISLRADSWGSLRATFNTDKTLIDGKWGLHVAVLNEEQQFEIEPSYWKKNAYYLNSTAKLSESTHLSVSYESRSDEVFQPSVNFTNLTDYYTRWGDFGNPQVSGTSSANRRATLTYADGSTEMINNLRDFGLERFGGSNPAYTFFDGEAEEYRGLAFTDRTRVRYPIETNGNFYTNRSFLVDQVDPGVWPRNVATSGLNNGTWVDYEAIDATLEQKIGENLHLQFVVGSNDSERLQTQLSARQLYRDPNYYLDDGARLNPHFGDYYIEVNGPVNFHRPFTAKTYTLTAAYNLNLEDRVESKLWGKLLGNHNFAVMHSNVEETGGIYRNRLLVTGTPDGPLNITNYLSGNYRARIREYVDPINDPANAHLKDYREYALSKEPFEIDGYTLQNVDGAAGAPGMSGTDVISNMFVSQSHFWDNRVIVNFGYRAEDIDFRRWLYASNPKVGRLYTAYEPLTRAQFADPDFVRTLTDDPSQKFDVPDLVYDSVSGVSRNLGAIFRVTQNIAIAANRANNINPASSRAGIYGTPLPFQSGDSEELGLRANFLDGTLRIEYNNYVTTNLNQTRSQGQLRVPFGDAQNMSAILFQQGEIAVDPFETGLGWDTRDIQARGHEMSVHYSKGPFSGRLAVSYNTNEQTNVGNQFAMWWNANKDLVAEFARGPGGELVNEESTSATPETFADSYQDALVRLESQRALEGQQDPNLTSWAVKFLGKYRFNEGRWKGLETGANIAWYDDSISGYWKMADRNFDFDRPFKAKGRTVVNYFTSYRKKLSLAGREVTWKVQLNINNLFDENDPTIRNFANTAPEDGSLVLANGLRYHKGRQFLLTNTFTF